MFSVWLYLLWQPFCGGGHQLVSEFHRLKKFGVSCSRHTKLDQVDGGYLNIFLISVEQREICCAGQFGFYFRFVVLGNLDSASEQI